MFIEFLENIIKVYSKYIKHDILLLVLIHDLNLNNHVTNYYDFFKSYDTFLFLKNL